MANPWFKFYGAEYLSDPKMLVLSACERSCWITLLSYSSVSGEIGVVKHLTEEALMTQSGISFSDDNWEKTKGVLKHFEDLGMIRNDNGVITIINWQKRQERSLTPYERVKRYREKKRNDNSSDTKMITTDKNRKEKIRKDTETILAAQGAADRNVVLLNPLIEKFKHVNPNYERIFPNKTQRTALDRLVKKFGFEKVSRMIDALPAIVGQKYAPRISTPIQLESKLGDLIAFVNQQKPKETNIIGL